jgi:hypothetical protein
MPAGRSPLRRQRRCCRWVQAQQPRRADWVVTCQRLPMRSTRAPRPPSPPRLAPPGHQGMGDTMKGSFFALAEAKYAGGDSIKHTVFDNVERATLKVGVPAEEGASKRAKGRCRARTPLGGAAAVVCILQVAGLHIRCWPPRAPWPEPATRLPVPFVPAFLQVYSSLDNVAGVKIPKFESVSQPGDTKMDLTGAFRRAAGHGAGCSRRAPASIWSERLPGMRLAWCRGRRPGLQLQLHGSPPPAAHLPALPAPQASARAGSRSSHAARPTSAPSSCSCSWPTCRPLS